MENGGIGASGRVKEGVSEIPKPCSGVAKDILLLGPDFHTGGIGPISSPDGKGEFRVDENPDRLVSQECPPVGYPDRLKDLFPDLFRIHRRRQ